MLPKRIDISQIENVPIDGGKRQVRVLFDKNTAPDIAMSLAHYSYQAGVTGPRHHHDCETEVYYCLSGSGRVRVGVEEYTMTPGVVIYIPPKVEHQTTSGPAGLEFLAIFAPSVEL